MKTVMSSYMEDIIKTSRESIRFDSTHQPTDGAYPFGKGCADCLAHFLATAEQLGFEVHNYDNYIGEVVYGEGEDFAILAHLDVVPAGDGWKYPPFAAELNDDVSEGGTEGMKIWGRGALDDKTPAVVILYALKALKDAGIMPKKRFKLILGCNEEDGWECIDHYNEVAKMPRSGFTPDADFPVIYAEFGILHLKLRFPLADSPIASLTAGDAINMVPARAEATLAHSYADARVSAPDGAVATISGDSISAVGRSAHGSLPHEGANALGAIIYALKSESPELSRIYDLLFGDALGIKTIKDSTGVLTMSPDLGSYRDGTLEICVDIRYPATHRYEEIIVALEEKGIDYEILSHKGPLYNDPDGELISTLRGVYSEYFGRDTAPVAIGGGTYARALECGCAFGPELHGFESTIHQPNEFITLEHIGILADVYYSALLELGK